jgi:preprotein translocase subunit SecA
VDNQWKDHLLQMDHLKEGIGLQAYGGKDPLVEYKKQGFLLFQDMVASVKLEVLRLLFMVQTVRSTDGLFPQGGPVSGEALHPDFDPNAMAPVAAAPSGPMGMMGGNAAPMGGGFGAPMGGQPWEMPPEGGQPGGPPQKVATIRHEGPRLGRNEPCYCGSGKKFKKCHGA